MICEICRHRTDCDNPKECGKAKDCGDYVNEKTDYGIVQDNDKKEFENMVKEADNGILRMMKDTIVTELFVRGMAKGQ